jgi:hypothetical protein
MVLTVLWVLAFLRKGSPLVKEQPPLSGEHHPPGELGSENRRNRRTSKRRTRGTEFAMEAVPRSA